MGRANGDFSLCLSVAGIGTSTHGVLFHVPRRVRGWIRFSWSVLAGGGVVLYSLLVDNPIVHHG